MIVNAMLAPLIQSTVLLLAGWKSFKAIESPDRADDTHWLTFWMVHCFCTFGKAVVDCARALGRNYFFAVCSRHRRLARLPPPLRRAKLAHACAHEKRCV